MEYLVYIKTKNTKFTLALLSGIMYTLGQGVLLGSCGIYVYILSYIHYKYDWVDLPYGNLMMPLMIFCMSLFAPLSGTLDKIYGPYISILISSIIVEICFFAFYLQRSIWAFYIITLISGFGSGISSNIVMKNACFYYPEKKGFISVGILSFTALGASISVYIGENIINPKKEGFPDPRVPYYSEQIANKSKNYFIFAMIVFPIFTLLTLLLFYKYNPVCELELSEKKIDDDQNEDENEEITKKEELKDTLVHQNNTKKAMNTFYKPNHFKNIKRALKTFRFWRNILIVGLIPFWISFINTSYRAYVAILGLEQDYIVYLSAGIAFGGFLLAPVWALFVDVFGFRPIMMVIGFISTGMPIYFYKFMQDRFKFVIGVIIINVIFVGVMSAIYPHVMQVYGITYFLTIGGFARLFNDLSVFIAAFISILISVYNENPFELYKPYKTMILIGGPLSAAGLALIFFENDDKFIYGDEKEKNNIIIKGGEEQPTESFEREKKFINENVSGIIDPNNLSKASNTNENTP